MKKCMQGFKLNAWHTISVKLMFVLITTNKEAILWDSCGFKDIMKLHKNLASGQQCVLQQA